MVYIKGLRIVLAQGPITAGSPLPLLSQHFSLRRLTKLKISVMTKGFKMSKLRLRTRAVIDCWNQKFTDFWNQTVIGPWNRTVTFCRKQRVTGSWDRKLLYARNSYLLLEPVTPLWNQFPASGKLLSSGNSYPFLEPVTPFWNQFPAAGKLLSSGNSYPLLEPVIPF